MRHEPVETQAKRDVLIEFKSTFKLEDGFNSQYGVQII